MARKKNTETENTAPVTDSPTPETSENEESAEYQRRPFKDRLQTMINRLSSHILSKTKLMFEIDYQKAQSPVNTKFVELLSDIEDARAHLESKLQTLHSFVDDEFDWKHHTEQVLTLGAELKAGDSLKLAKPDSILAIMPDFDVEKTYTVDSVHILVQKGEKRERKQYYVQLSGVPIRLPVAPFVRA